MSQKIIVIVISLIVFLAACTTAESSSVDSEATEFVILTPTAFPTFAPTPTPQLTDGLPSIELLSGSADACSNDESYTNLLGFTAIQDEMTTENHIEFRLLDSQGNVLADDDTPGENNDGEVDWGFYPPAYDVEAETALVLELQVYESDAEGALLTSSASLIFNCTTGETISSTIFRTPISE
ncbi:MAG: hypothetical protein WBC91_01750 [Phototrophicaceae bacterium]